MLPQNTEKSRSHTSCSDDILTVSYLPYLCAYYFRNTGPAGHTDHKGQTQDICISHNSLQQNDQEQSWYT